VFEPLNYGGRPYRGRLCCFLGLDKDPQKPYAGPQSRFRRLLVEVNGEQPFSPNVGVEIFVNVIYDIEIVTVKTDREGKLRSPEHWYSVVREIHVRKQQSGTRTLQPSNTLPSNNPTPRTQTTLATEQHSNTANTPLGKAVKTTRARTRKFG
jgi:hypothetical protein